MMYLPTAEEEEIFRRGRYNAIVRRDGTIIWNPFLPEVIDNRGDNRMRTYESKTTVQALQNLGRDNEDQILEFFETTKLRFQVTGEFEFTVYGLGDEKVIWGFGDWILWWGGNFIKTMNNPMFHARFREKDPDPIDLENED